MARKTTLRMDKDSHEIEVHHYEAFDIKPDHVRCEHCKALLDRLECVQITPKERTRGPWFCKDHFPLVPIISPSEQH
jgi:hypothetical protein